MSEVGVGGACEGKDGGLFVELVGDEHGEIVEWVDLDGETGLPIIYSFFKGIPVSSSSDPLKLEDVDGE